MTAKRESRATSIQAELAEFKVTHVARILAHGGGTALRRRMNDPYISGLGRGDGLVPRLAVEIMPTQPEALAIHPEILALEVSHPSCPFGMEIRMHHVVIAGADGERSCDGPKRLFDFGLLASNGFGGAHVQQVAGKADEIVLRHHLGKPVEPATIGMKIGTM